MENDSAKTIKDQWGIDPLEGVTLNEVQQTIVDEALGNAESMRTEKPVGMDLENKYKGSFGQCDSLIGGLGNDLKKQLLRNVYINENPKWHPERNSLVHIKIVMSRGIETGDQDLVTAALYHDIAKFDTVSFNKMGWPTSLGHDKAGAESASTGGANELVVYICAKHMVIKGWLASSTGGPSEGGELNPNTKFKIFAEAPGADNNEKAKAFWKLCVFSKMDNMGNDFNAESLKWNNPSYDKWDEECPLKDQFKKAELIEIKAEKAPVAFTAQDIMKFGAKGPQIGQINKEISGKTKEEAFEIIKRVLGNPDLTMEKVTNKRWVKTFESFRKDRINENTDDKKDRVSDFLYSDEVKQDTGITSFTTCDEDDWDKVKNYISGKGINGVTGKAYFLNNNKDITEEEFDKYYDEWLDNIEEQRGYEDMNQQDMNW
jgi:hypothetical protein